MKIWVDFLASFEGNNDGGDGTNNDGGNSSGDFGGGAGDRDPRSISGGGNNNAGQRSGDGSGVRTFTQEEVNKFLAEDRRKHQEKYQALEENYQKLLKNQNLSKEERDQLESELEDLRARHRTREQQLAYEKKQAEEQYQNQLKEWQERAKNWESRYTQSTINRELQAAAIEHDAYNPELVVVHLRSQTNLEEQKDEEGKPTGQLMPMVTMTVRNSDTGAQENLKMTPAEAVEYMKKNPEKYGGFFKNNIREGIGSSSATGGAMTGDGTVDVRKITDEQFFKLRRENPEALGLKARGRARR